MTLRKDTYRKMLKLKQKTEKLWGRTVSWDEFLSNLTARL